MKTALVTGASGALGAAIAKVLDGKGYRLALHYSANEESARKLQAELTNESIVVQADVADWESVKAMDETVHGELGVVSVLVNSGAIRKDGLMATQSVADWHETIQTNLIGTFHTCRAVLPGMLRQRWGRIINVVSPAGLIGSRGQTAYSASKAGVIGMTRSLALECGKRKVTVNALSPGFMETKLTDEVPEEVRKAFYDRTAIRRFGTPDEVAAGVGLLVDAEYMTGQVLSIDGGISIS
ncbi:3-oxoacyl-[acyl-carrier protein] reductase [Amycolatopsis xylanica]|uniref:3-oxoacyl-[acyl-carrier protein] reductase n=1 Tax=Amycolatopsis xylanica TaxID=589385 RepID=A0A1H3PI35_9PSEU|nr:SDR family NAD(P)-dependent oxidoreductase [Amycolatopsis xylanica]SDZ00059.1 3-oxoacyl-[acyl-carrier protein] reductase [Amycolatopsis xylanica]